MTIQDLGSIGELLAAVATVVTLAYLAIQIRANTRATKAQSGQARTASNKQTLLVLAQDQHLAGIFRRGLADLESLEPDEQIQFVFLITSFLSDAHASFTDVKLGVSDLSEFETLWSGFRSILATPGGRECWRRTRAASYSKDFRIFVDADLLESDAHAS